MEKSARLSLALAEMGTNELTTEIARFLVGFSLHRHGHNGEARRYIEHAYEVFERLGQFFWQAKAYRWLSQIRLNLSEIDESQFFNSSSLDLARRSGERRLLADAMANKAIWSYKNMQIKEAFQYAEQADELFKQLGQAMNSSIQQFAVLYWLIGDLQKARSLLFEHQQHLGLLGEKFVRSNQLAILGRLAMEDGDQEQALTWLSEAREIKQEIGHSFGEAVCLADLSHLAYLQGSYDRFKQIVRECLTRVQQGPERDILYILSSLIACPFFQRPEILVPLLGMMEVQCRRIGYSIDPLRKRYCDRAGTAARSALGDGAFEAALGEGANLTIDEAIVLILQKAEEL
jgi:tetratricopeptide (TPR) repeat protein